MDRIDVYNLALETLNIEPLASTTDLTSSSTEPIVKTLNTFFGTALRKASREHNWSFLTERIELEGDDNGAMGGYRHSYALPDDLFRLCGADGGDYRRVGNMILTNGRPIIFAITLDKDRRNNYYFGQEELVPDDFWELVAYELAILASTRLSSGDSKTQIIASIYNDLLQTLISNDVKNESHFITRTFEEDQVEYESESKQRRNWNVQFAETENTWT